MPHSPALDTVTRPYQASRAAFVGLLAAMGALAVPAPAHASLMSPEVEDAVAGYIAIFVLFFVPVLLIVLFWLVHDAEKAALEVQDYAQAVSWAAQTALRDIIGRTTLADLLRGREQIELDLQKLIDQRSTPWGVTVSSVEMRDIVIPSELQDAMSREAQAAREKQARIILGEAELAVARSFEEASRVYQDNPTALHLRGMNMLYEGLKEKGALMIVPSTAVESMGMGGLIGGAAMRQSELVREDEKAKV